MCHGGESMQRELTDVFIRTIKPPAAGRMEVWDTRVTGLVLRVTPTGGYLHGA